MALRLAAILLILCSHSGKSQDFTQANWPQLLAFGTHLHRNQLHDEQQSFCNTLLSDPKYPSSQLDTIQFMKARAFFYQNQPAAAIQSLKEISTNTLISKSNLLISYSRFLINDLENEQKKTTNSNDLLSEQLALSHGLMSRNFGFVDSISTFSTQSSKLTVYNEIGAPWRGHRQKSPLIAGLLSSAVPGLGKWYAGNFNQAAGSFLSVALSGIQAIEGYRSGGLKNGRFIAFGVLTSVFYIANIWGSIVSVNVYEQELYDEVHRQLALQLSIDLNRLWELN